MPLYIQRLSDTASFPKRSTEGSAGMDIAADEDSTIPEYSRCWVSTGISIAIAPAHVGLIWPRSGLAASGLDTSAGVIDSDYRGELKVLLCNGTPHPRRIRQGDRIAQLIVLPIASPTLVEVDTLPEASCRHDGFGSSGL